MRYWDTSVPLKPFVEENNSAFFATLIEEAGAVIHTSELSRLELLRALWGKRLEEAIRRGAEERLMHRFESEVETGRIILIPIGREIRRQFETVLKVVTTGSDQFLCGLWMRCIWHRLSLRKPRKSFAATCA